MTLIVSTLRKFCQVPNPQKDIKPFGDYKGYKEKKAKLMK